LLINFWSTRLQANKAAIKAVIINKIGDVAYLIATALLFSYCGSVQFTTANAAISQIFNELQIHRVGCDTIPHPPILTENLVSLYILENQQINIVNIICLIFLVAISAKSAQFGLHT